MALAESRWQRTVMFCALYVAQGVPWGFMLITLPTYLASFHQVGDTQIGRLKAIILVPWTFKLIWAPLIDGVTIRSMGRRRPWIIGAELWMAITLLGLLCTGDMSQEIRLLCWMYFVHNCFASLQDVCTDALAVDVLPPQEQGRMNGFMWGSKLVGKGVGATLLAYVLRDWGLEACVVVQIVLLLVIMMFPLLILERAGERRFPWGPRAVRKGVRPPQSQPKTNGLRPTPKGSDPFSDSHSSARIDVRGPRAVLGDVFRAYSLPTSLAFIVFTLAMLIPSSINEVVSNTLYTQQLGWSAVEYSMAAGLWVIAPQMVGAALGGLLADRFGRRTIITVGMAGMALLAMLFAACPHLWNRRWFATAYLLSFEGLLAMASVGFLSMAMRISWTRSAATVFTSYMTLSNMSHVLGNWLAGPVRAAFCFGDTGASANLWSYDLTFWLVGVASLPPLLLLPWIRADEVDRCRRAETDPPDRG